MVSANLRGVAMEFEDMLAEQDFGGLVGLAAIGTLGSTVVEMWQDRVSPRLGYSTEPTNGTGLFVSFLVKMAFVIVWGLAVVWAADNMPALALPMGIMGIGAAIQSGTDLVEALDMWTRGGTTSTASNAISRTRTSTSSNSGNSSSSQSRSRSRTARSANSGSTRASASIGGRRGGQSDDLMEGF